MTLLSNHGRIALACGALAFLALAEMAAAETLANARFVPASSMKLPDYLVPAIDPVSVISTPTYGNLTAPAIVKQLKIQSQKDTKQLAEAKEIAYKEGFYSGTMLVGEFKGESAANPNY